MLRLIHPRLEAQLMLAKNCQLIEALQEVQIHEQDTAFLSPQCQFILGKGSIEVTSAAVDLYPFMYVNFFPENSELMKEELKRQPSMIERLYG